MRSLRKPLLLLLAVAMVVSVTVYATVAFYSDVEEIENTFSVGKVDITLYETKTDEYGNPKKDLNGNPEVTFDSNNYHLVPGKSYVKDPTVSIAQGSESCYVRMVVSVNCAQAFKDYFARDGKDGFLSFTNYYDNDQGVNIKYGAHYWTLYDAQPSKTKADTMIYEFRYYIPVWNGGETLKSLFTQISVPGGMSGSQLAAFADLNIVVQAHAIQLSGFGHSPEGEQNAWTAFTGEVNDPYVIKPGIH